MARSISKGMRRLHTMFDGIVGSYESRLTSKPGQGARPLAGVLAAPAPAKSGRKLGPRVADRRQEPAGDFALPRTRRYPIYDAYHASLALTHLLRVAKTHGPRQADARVVLAAVKKRWPGVIACEGDLVSKIRKAHKL